MSFIELKNVCKQYANTNKKDRHPSIKDRRLPFITD